MFHGWKVVMSGGTIMFLQALFLIQGYGQYAAVLERDFGWSKSFLASGYSLTRSETALLGPFQGWALDRFGPRRVMTLGLVLLSGGMMALSQIQTKTQFLAALVVAAVGASLSGFLSVTTATVRWFERLRARALATQSLGFALGGLAIPLLVFSLEAWGWRATTFGAGIAVLLIGLPLMPIFSGTPAERGESIDGPNVSASTVKAEGVSDVHLSLSQALRTPAFWLISFGHASALLVVGAVLAHLSLFLINDHGYSLQQASFVVSGVTLCQIMGMGIGGWAGDRTNKRFLAAGAMLAHGLALFLLAIAQGSILIWTFAVLHGTAWGIRGPLMPSLRADYFGSTSFGKIMGISSVIAMGGTAAGPLIAGILADSTGSYELGFTILGATAAAGMMFFLAARPPRQPAAATG